MAYKDLSSLANKLVACNLINWKVKLHDLYTETQSQHKGQTPTMIIQINSKCSHSKCTNVFIRYAIILALTRYFRSNCHFVSDTNKHYEKINIKTFNYAK